MLPVGRWNRRTFSFVVYCLHHGIPKITCSRKGKRLVAQDLHRAMGGQAPANPYWQATPFQGETVWEGRADGGQTIRNYDMGGGAPQPPSQMPAGYSNYAASPMFGAPFLGGIQVPHFSGTGGYSSPATSKTSPVQLMMAAQPHARGGDVSHEEWARGGSIEDAAAALHAKLEGLKRAQGGQVKPKYKDELTELLGQFDGPITKEPIDLKPKEADHAKIWQLVKKVEKELPNVTNSQKLSVLCGRSPDIRRFLKDSLALEHGRSSAYCQLHGYLKRHYDEGFSDG
jgi:hypothetical protein